MMQLQQQVSPGIHVQPFYSPDGHLVLIAVADDGREVERVSVRRPRDYGVVKKYLEAKLAAASVDPLRPLALPVSPYPNWLEA